MTKNEYIEGLILELYEDCETIEEFIASHELLPYQEERLLTLKAQFQDLMYKLGELKV